MGGKKKDCVIDDCLSHKLVAVSCLSRIISLHYHLLFRCFFFPALQRESGIKMGTEGDKGKKGKGGDYLKKTSRTEKIRAALSSDL